MNDVKSLSKKLDGARLALQRVGTELQQVRETAGSAEQHESKLADLLTERQTILVRALVAKKTADTAKIDSDIATAEAQLAAVSVARDALPIYEQAVQQAREDVAAIELQRREAVEAHIVARHDAAQERYLQAIASMESAVEEMVGAHAAWELMCRNGNASEFPCRGRKVLEDLRSEGLRVPWNLSRLKDPAVAAQYTDNFRNFWYVPAWADSKSIGFGDSTAAKLVNDARDAGHDCREYVGAKAPVPDPMVMVRVNRGTISTSEIRLDPLTHGVAQRRSLQHGPYSDVELPEKFARQLAASGVVVIHGEGPLPERSVRLKEEPLRVEMKPQNPHGPIHRRQSMTANYSGFYGEDYGLSNYPD
ncbi:hypothetical protein [Paraburkholderia ferrariae]|uniref:hypothetical protein n=1 Tax=Paraburkholderia ferrariae TaxID=386056 RepID=UPI0004809CB9|nr:hypothetical protein [Paraburkholderia ferrariae]